MPAWEFSVLLKVLPRAETVASLKRVGTTLLDQGVIIHRLENLGLKDLPHRMQQEDETIHRGQYFVFHFMGARDGFKKVLSFCERDLNFLRFNFVPAFQDLKKGCTLQEELLPPVYRESVQKLMEQGRRYRKITKKHYWHYRDYNYFDKYM